MKHLYILLLFCLSLQASNAQTTDYSYVRSRTMTNAGGTTWLDHYDYDNGLGQVYQQVDVGITPQGNSLVTLHEYDDQRRPWRTWLPTPMSGSGIQGPVLLCRPPSRRIRIPAPSPRHSTNSRPLNGSPKNTSRALPGVRLTRSSLSDAFSAAMPHRRAVSSAIQWFVTIPDIFPIPLWSG